MTPVQTAQHFAMRNLMNAGARGECCFEGAIDALMLWLRCGWRAEARRDAQPLARGRSGGACLHSCSVGLWWQGARLMQPVGQLEPDCRPPPPLLHVQPPCSRRSGRPAAVRAGPGAAGARRRHCRVRLGPRLHAASQRAVRAGAALQVGRTCGWPCVDAGDADCSMCTCCALAYRSGSHVPAALLRVYWSGADRRLAADFQPQRRVTGLWHGMPRGSRVRACGCTGLLTHCLPTLPAPAGGGT